MDLHDPIGHRLPMAEVVSIKDIMLHHRTDDLEVCSVVQFEGLTFFKCVRKGIPLITATNQTLLAEDVDGEELVRQGIIEEEELWELLDKQDGLTRAVLQPKPAESTRYVPWGETGFRRTADTPGQ